MSRKFSLSIIVALLIGATALIYRSLPSILYSRIDQPAMMPRLEPLNELGSLSAKRCGACHQEIYKEWASSLMGNAATNPFFRFERAEQKNLWLCGRCHFPLENQSQLLVSGIRSFDPLTPIATTNPSYDPALEEEGVTCVVCHMRAGEQAIINARALPDAVPPHKLITGDPAALCVRCHQFDPLGTKTFRPPLDTFAEQVKKETCTSCHMPELKRAATATSPVRMGHDHRFLGVRDGAFIAHHLSSAIGQDADGIFVELENRADHRMPTGEPSRVLRARVELLRADGTRVAERVIRILRDMDTIAVADRFDTTLTALERRKIRVNFARAEIEQAAHARVILEFARYEAAHPLVQTAGPERFFGLDLSAHVATETIALTPSK